MPKPFRFTYKKKAPFRDAFFFIIVCEGTNREPDYFRFFDGISSRVKVVPVKSTTGSAPNQLVSLALAKEVELSADITIDKLWFVIDTDRWGTQLHTIRQYCEQHQNWKVAQSNPCFEVWLYFHAKSQLPQMAGIDRCSSWKPHIPKVIQGGFNHDIHPIAIETAIENSRANYQETGYFPEVGSTQLWRLGEELLPIIKNELEKLKNRFPAPEIIG